MENQVSQAIEAADQLQKSGQVRTGIVLPDLVAAHHRRGLWELCLQGLGHFASAERFARRASGRAAPSRGDAAPELGHCSVSQVRVPRSQELQTSVRCSAGHAPGPRTVAEQILQVPQKPGAPESGVWEIADRGPGRALTETVLRAARRTSAALRAETRSEGRRSGEGDFTAASADSHTTSAAGAPTRLARLVGIHHPVVRCRKLE